MKKKKIISVGIFAVAIALGAGVAYYCYPLAINNALGINSAGIDAISDSASSSLAVIDPDIGSDDAEANDGTSLAPVAPAPAVVASPSSGKKSVASAVSSAASGPTGGQDLSDSAITTSSSELPSAASSTIDTLPIAPCVFPSSASAPPTTREVIFNEIAWMGSSLSSTAEWIEIKNIMPTAVNLSGWELLDASGKIKISFTSGDGALAPGGLLLLSRGTTASAIGASAAKIYSGDLVNTGDMLALMDPQCTVSDYLDASGGWPAGNNTTKQTLERDVDGIGWHTSALPGGTPGAANSIVAVAVATTTPSTMPAPISQPQSQPSNVVSTEIAPENISTSSGSGVTASTSIATSSAQTIAATSTNSGNTSDSNISAIHVLIAAVQIAGASSSNDFVKLYNPTAAAIDVSGWKLHKKSSTGTDYSLKVFPAGSVISAGQSFTWANADDGFSDAVDANVSSTETLAADNSVALMDAAGNIVDAVAWGTGANQYDEGPPYPTSPGANQLLSRRSSDGVMADTDNNSNDFTIQ